MAAVLLTTGVAGRTLSTSVAGALVPPALAALSVMEYVPASLGAPAITPLIASKARPSGNPSAAKMFGALVAEI